MQTCFIGVHHRVGELQAAAIKLVKHVNFTNTPAGNVGVVVDSFFFYRYIPQACADCASAEQSGARADCPVSTPALHSTVWLVPWTSLPSRHRTIIQTTI